MKRLFSDFKNNKEEFSHLLYANSGVKNELRFWKDSDDEHRFNNLPGNVERREMDKYRDVTTCFSK